MSGMQASRAICGVPGEISGEDVTGCRGSSSEHAPGARAPGIPRVRGAALGPRSVPLPRRQDRAAAPRGRPGQAGRAVHVGPGPAHGRDAEVPARRQVRRALLRVHDGPVRESGPLGLLRCRLRRHGGLPREPRGPLDPHRRRPPRRGARPPRPVRHVPPGDLGGQPGLPPRRPRHLRDRQAVGRGTCSGTTCAAARSTSSVATSARPRSPGCTGSSTSRRARASIPSVRWSTLPTNSPGPSGTASPGWSDGEIEMPDATLLLQAAASAAHRSLAQVGVRQFRTAAGDGATGSTPELVDITTVFHTIVPNLIGHGFHVEVHPLDSHPLARSPRDRHPGRTVRARGDRRLHPVGTLIRPDQVASPSARCSTVA